MSQGVLVTEVDLKVTFGVHFAICSNLFMTLKCLLSYIIFPLSGYKGVPIKIEIILDSSLLLKEFVNC